MFIWRFVKVQHSPTDEKRVMLLCVFGAMNTLVSRLKSEYHSATISQLFFYFQFPKFFL